MRKKNKTNNSSSHKTVSKNKDDFNVKENLRKLRSGPGKEGEKTSSDIYKTEYSDRYYGTSQREELGSYFTTSTTDRFEQIKDKFNSDVSSLNKNFSEHQKNVFNELNKKIDKTEFGWLVGGAATVLVVIGTLVYTLSYQDLIVDVKDLKENRNEINLKLNDFENKLQQKEKDIHSILPKELNDSIKKY